VQNGTLWLHSPNNRSMKAVVACQPYCFHLLGVNANRLQIYQLVVLYTLVCALLSMLLLWVSVRLDIYN
jgi:hypothetical protein